MYNITLNEFLRICPDAVIGVDREGIITIFNNSAVKLLGYGPDEVIDKKSIIRIYNSPEEARKIKRIMYSKDFGPRGRLIDFETELKTKAGNFIPILLSAMIIEDNGIETGSIGFFHDLTVRKKMETKLRELSVTDSLTQLYNHRYFHIKISDEINRIRRYNRQLSLICFDLDNFKQVNDKMGHLDGDKILVLMGSVIRSEIRSTDLPFRYGGDEFMIILPETGLDKAVQIAERIRVKFALSWPFSPCSNYDIERVTTSIGVAQANPDESPAVFIKRADLAMYEAKKDGGNRVVTANSRIGV